VDLSDWRERIDALDRQLVDLLNERMSCAQEIGRIKKESGRPVRDPEREQALLDKLKAYNQGPVEDDSLEAIYRQIIQAAIGLEEEED
jgi:chorismate mutase/prephenate dehydratase